MTAVILVPLLAGVCLPGPAFCQTLPTQSTTQAAPAAAPASDDGDKFSAEQLEQMVAPIALYSDPLLSQVLMATTYPIEIVLAWRWVEKNPNLKGKELEEALKSQDWDESVKSLCGLPDVLKRLNDNLDWTQDLGDAFLAQKSELMDAAQRMRGKAYDLGNLKTTEQQTVTQQEDKIIVIQQTDPEVVYVPQYSATVVYGSYWGYPYYYYPPYYYAPYGWGAVAFTAGVFWGAAMWGGCAWGWGHSDVNIDIDRNNNFNRNTQVNPLNRERTGGNNKGNWNHNAEHRKGAGYRDSQTAQKFGGGKGSTRVSNNQARGYGDSSAAGRGQASRGQSPSASTRGGSGVSAQPSTRGGGGAGGGSLGSSGGHSGGSEGFSGGGGGSFSGGSSSAWSGSRGSSSFDRSASSRGSSSRGFSGGGGRRR